MKTKLALITTAVTIGFSALAQAGPSWGFTLGNGAGFYYGNKNVYAQQSVSRYYCRPSQTVYYVSPQYYSVPIYYQPRPVYRNNCEQGWVVPSSWR
jgi:hypothetical protein